MKTDPHVLKKGTFEISGLSAFGDGLPMQRKITVHDGTSILTSLPGGWIEFRIVARRCPGPGVCVSIVDHVPLWVRAWRWLKWR